jgi:hypothetical protein
LQIPECGRRLWAICEEKVGKAWSRHAEVGVCPVFPLLSQSLVVNPLEFDIPQSSSDRIESCSKSNNVEFTELAIRGDDSLFDELLDGRLLAIDDMNVGLIEGIIVVLFERRPLGSERVRRF